MAFASCDWTNSAHAWNANISRTAWIAIVAEGGRGMAIAKNICRTVGRCARETYCMNTTVSDTEMPFQISLFRKMQRKICRCPPNSNPKNQCQIITNFNSFRQSRRRRWIWIFEGRKKRWNHKHLFIYSMHCVCSGLQIISALLAHNRIMANIH